VDLRNKSDLAAGISVATFGTYVTVASSRLAYSSEYGPGPGFLPLWLGIGLLVLSLCLTVKNLARGAPEVVSKPEFWRTSARVLGGWLALMLAILLLPWIGLSLSLALLTLFLVLALERRSPWTAIGVALGLAVGFHLIFVSGLGLSLPVGPWGF
jgi:putative tricarboxylic transport membrane protein